MSVPKLLSPTLVVLLICCALATPALAVFELPVSGQLAYGVPQDVAISGNYAYVAAQGAVSVFDITNRANPTQVAVINTSGSAEGVAVSGGYLYVADWDGGLKIFRLTSPAAPAPAGSCNTPGFAYGVAVNAAGTYAFVADHAAGVQAINLTTLAVTGAFDTPGYAWDVAVSGNYVLVADGFAGLLILDATDPASMTEVTTLATTDRVLDVSVSGDYAYLAQAGEGLSIVDISGLPVPATVGEVGSLATTGTASGVFAANGFAYLAAGTAGLHVIDVIDPSDPKLLESCNTAGTAVAVDVDVATDTACVADGYGGLVVVDVAASPSPTIVRQIETSGNAEAVAVADSVAYVADGSGGIDAFSTTDPANPTRKADYPVGAGAMQAMDVVAEGSYAYVADWNASLRVVDLTATPPAVAASLEIPGHPNGIAISGTSAYVAAGDTGLTAVDITTPLAPGVLWTANTSGSANDVVLDGAYAFVADGPSGLQIIDTTSPTGAMVTVPMSGSGGYAWGVAYAANLGGGTDDYAFLAAGDRGLQMIDVTTPASASVVATVALSGSAHSVDVYGNYAYVSVGGRGVAVVRIDGSGPTLTYVTTVGTPSVPGPSDLVVAGGFAFVADAESGFAVVDLLPPYTALATRQSPSAGEKLAAAAQSDGSAVAWIASGPMGLQIVQVGDAEAADSPALIRSKLGFGDVTDVALKGTYAYIADAGGRLSVASLSNPTNPSLTGTEETAGAAIGVTGMTVGAASYALVADGSKGLSVISTTNPSSPTQKATFDTSGWSSDVVPATLGGDPFACVADGESGLRLINLSPLGTPDVTVFSDDFEDGFAGWTTTGTVQSYTGSPRRGTHSVRLLQNGSMKRTIPTVGFGDITVSYYLGAAFTTTDAAVAAEWSTNGGATWETALTTIRKDDLDEDGALHPYSTEMPATAGDTASLALRFVLSGSGTGDYAYVDDVTVKSSSGSDPFESGFYNTPGQARGVAVSGTLAYVADGEKGLRVIDISSPGHPQEIGSVDTAGYAESLRMLGNIAVVADGDNGLVLLDCSTPTNPWELAHYQTQGYASDVALAADHAYLLENGWGLTILELWYTFRDVLFSQWAFEEIETIVANGLAVGYPDGLYHPEILCSRDQMAVFIARAHAGGDGNVPEYTGEPSFADVDADNWAFKYIEYCYAEGIIEGYVVGTTAYYHPLVTVTRDSMAVFMARAAGLITLDDEMDTAPTLFPDVPEGFWAGLAIQECIGAGIVHGYDDGLYRPYVPVTRDQMAVFLYRTFGLSL